MTSLQAGDEPGSAADVPLWLRTVQLVGVPSAIALFLTWFMTNGLQADVRATRDDTAAIRTKIERQAVDTEQINRMLLRICVNTAQNDAQRQECFR